jgi:hypothetical protein
MTMTVQTTARNATLADLAELLTEQNGRKVDIVAPASKIRSLGGNFVIEGTESILSAEGVTQTDGTYRPTTVCDEGVASKLGIPLAYVRKLREERPDLYDANVNGWLRGARMPERLSIEGERAWRDSHPADPRSFMVRCFRGDGDGPGVARAFLSDSYKVIDNLDALTAALAGVRQAGANISVTGCDLTDRRMYVRIEAPEVTALAPTLLENYRSPFSGQSGRDLPVVSAGLVISNSETGGGAFTIVPRFVVKVCSNGMTITKDALRAVHLGGKMDEGVIQWSAETEQKQLDLITSKAKDAVATFLNVDYMERVIRSIEATAATPLTDSVKVIESVGSKLFTKEQTAGVLDHFIKGGDVSAGGVLHAVTSFAQTIDDADVASDLEANALRAMELAAAG